MLESITTFLAIVGISFIPVVLWGYLFAYIDDKPMSNIRFLAGVFGWILAVTPILYVEQISAILGFEFLNTFWVLENISSFFSAFQIGASLFFLLLFIALFSLLNVAIFHSWIALSKTYFKNIWVSILFILTLILLFWIIQLVFVLFPWLNVTLESGVGGSLLPSLRFVIFYYIIVWFIEEVSKHFNFLPSSAIYIDHYKRWVLYAIFVALGFSFTENILYLYNHYTHSGMSEWFLKLYFFRSIFSIIVHVFASSVIAYYFSRCFLLYRQKNINFPYIKIFLWWLFCGVLLHSIFDIALTLWLSFVIVLYFIGGYFYITNLLYRE